ncbi:hypothetical protein, partial [Kocuria rosea]|uniref:hypothetical protein n=3 Tax=Bacteria TaxID=2 RepID=UPI002B24F653
RWQPDRGVEGFHKSNPSDKYVATKNRSASQARKDRAALKRLQKSGIFKGKIDLRKKPTRRQRELIEQLKRPLPPKQKVDGATIKRTRMSETEVRNITPATQHKLTTYALPFLRKGQTEPEWRRFTREQLAKFLNEYKADDPEGKAEWRSYAVREDWTFGTKTERTEFRREADLYFTGVRISEPQGIKTQRRAPNKKAHRGRRKGK